MNLILLNETVNYINDEKVLGEMFSTINSKIEESGLYFSHLLIDGEEVYSEHDSYIIEKINSISNIEVVVMTSDEMISDLLNSLENYLKNSLATINGLVDDFYNNPNEETWSQFLNLLEGLEWVIQAITTIDKHNHKIVNWDEFLSVIATLQAELMTLMEAMENKDAVLIGDVIQYEILPILETLSKVTTKTIDQQFVRNGVS